MRLAHPSPTFLDMFPFLQTFLIHAGFRPSLLSKYALDFLRSKRTVLSPMYYVFQSTTLQHFYKYCRCHLFANMPHLNKNIRVEHKKKIRKIQAKLI